MRLTIERELSAGLNRIELTVRAPNKGVLALYEKFGFVLEGVQRNAIRADGRYEDLLCMGLLLTGG
jgi:RimJ/RimL family protein N-acetyltransferase